MPRGGNTTGKGYNLGGQKARLMAERLAALKKKNALAAQKNNIRAPREIAEPASAQTKD